MGNFLQLILFLRKLNRLRMEWRDLVRSTPCSVVAVDLEAQSSISSFRGPYQLVQAFSIITPSFVFFSTVYPFSNSYYWEDVDIELARANQRIGKVTIKSSVPKAQRRLYLIYFYYLYEVHITT